MRLLASVVVGCLRMHYGSDARSPSSTSHHQRRRAMTTTEFMDRRFIDRSRVRFISALAWPWSLVTGPVCVRDFLDYAALIPAATSSDIRMPRRIFFFEKQKSGKKYLLNPLSTPIKSAGIEYLGRRRRLFSFFCASARPVFRLPARRPAARDCKGAPQVGLAPPAAKRRRVPPIKVARNFATLAITPRSLALA